MNEYAFTGMGPTWGGANHRFAVRRESDCAASFDSSHAFDPGAARGYHALVTQVDLEENARTDLQDRQAARRTILRTWPFPENLSPAMGLLSWTGIPLINAVSVTITPITTR